MDAHHSQSRPQGRSSPARGTPGIDDRGVRDPVDAHAPARRIRPLKAVGLVGYVLLIAAIALLATALAAAAGSGSATPWIVGTVVCGGAGLACLVAVRIVLAGHPAHDRPQHDPLIPEVTEEEALGYEREFHGREAPNARGVETIHPTTPQE